MSATTRREEPPEPFLSCASSRLLVATLLRILAAVALLLTGCRSPAPDPEPEGPYRREHPPDVARTVSATRHFDHRPYEFIWDPRPPPHIPLVDFDLLIDWTATSDDGVEVDFARSQDEQLWGSYTGRLQYRAPAFVGTGLRIQPPESIRIPGRFDSVDLWVYGPGAGCGARAGEDGPVLTLLLMDAEGSPLHIPMGALTWGGWEIMHYRVPGDLLDTMRHPLTFNGFLLDHLPPGRDGVIFIDALAFYVEPLHPLQLGPRPARNLELPPGLSPGLHLGEPSLPFPVDDATVIPPHPAGTVRNRVAESGRRRYEFVCETDAFDLRYTLDLNELERAICISWNGTDLGHLVGGGRILGSEPVVGRLLLARLEDGRVRAEFEGGAVYTFGVSGRSLVVDAYARSEGAEGFSLGRYDGPLRYTALDVPGLGAEANPWAAVGVLTGGAESNLPPLFLSAVLDWYRSEASEVKAAVPGAPTGGAFARTVYRPNTAGERNDLFERAVLSVSPRFEDVLPRLAQPAGRRADALVNRIWADSDGPLDYASTLEASRRLAALGLTHIVQGHGETCWRDGYESCTLRTRAAPARGGDEVLATFVASQQELGWRIGLPASYFGIHGLSPFWSPDHLGRTPDGNWSRTPSGHFGLKAPVAVGFQQEVASTVEAKFQPALAYVRDVAAAPPWAFTDYDARVPGAGRFTQVYYSAGELLLAEGDAIDGPLVCEGGGEAYYAGLVDGYLASAPKRPARPYVPAFYLARVNPLACGFGVGPAVPRGEDPDRFTDAMLADQIAYGRAGRLAPDHVGLERRCRSYYMMRELQARYLLKAPLRIAYWDGQSMVSSSDAITGGALSRSQLYLNYPGDLEIWVNGSADLDWKVRLGRDTWVLPPSGWVASGPGLLEVSALVDGRRIDYLKTDDFLYYDGRGRSTAFRGWSSTGPLAVWLPGDADPSSIEVLDLGGTGRFALNPEGLVPDRVDALDLDRRPSGSASLVPTGQSVAIRGPEGQHLYRISLKDPPAESPPEVPIAEPESRVTPES